MYCHLIINTYLFHNLHSFNNGSENDVFTIQPGCLSGTQEKLRTVGVGASVGHGENSWTGVLQREVLVFELVSVDGFSTSSVVVGEVSALTHEVGDDSVEGGSLESETLFSGAKTTEVFSCLWDDI